MGGKTLGQDWSAIYIYIYIIIVTVLIYYWIEFASSSLVGEEIWVLLLTVSHSRFCE